ncbi:MAG: hypothetical protein AAGG48_31295 [Planctomycetota bacterium]
MAEHNWEAEKDDNRELILPVGLAHREWWSREIRIADAYEKELLLNMLVFHTSVTERRRVRLAWSRHKRSIIRLWKEGFYGSETIFFPHEGRAGSSEYANWLEDLFLDVDQSRISDAVLLVLQQGPLIRQRMNTEPAFREEFRKHLWPSLVSVTSKSNQPFELYAQHPNVWDLLKRPEGKQLAEKFGAFAILSLAEPPLYDPGNRPTIVRLLQSGNPDILEFICNPKHRRLYEFNNFLRRVSHFDDTKLAMAVLRLHDEKDSLLTVLNHFKVLDEQGLLAQEFADVFDRDSWDDSLPGYIKLAKRRVLGQRLDSGDEARATIDGTVHLLEIVDQVIGVTPLAPLKPATEIVSAAASDVGGRLSDELDRKVAERQAVIEELRQSFGRAIDPAFIGSRSHSLLVAFSQGQLLTEFHRLSELQSEPSPRNIASVLTFFYSQCQLSPSAARIAKQIWDGTLVMHQVGDMCIIPAEPAYEGSDVDPNKLRVAWFDSLRENASHSTADPQEQK